MLATATVLLLGPGACGSGSTTVETGALLLRITVPGGAAVPETLQLWTYDDGGLIFDGVRVPPSGTLPPRQSDGTLGTVLIQSGLIHGSLRLHVRALRTGARILDAVASVAADEGRTRKGRMDLALSATVPIDDDGDDVPDVIDDCPTEPNPAQGGCRSTGDAGTDGAGTGGDTGEGGAASNGGATGNGGAAGSGNAGTGGVQGSGGSGSGGARTGGMGTGGVATGGMGTGGARTGGTGTGGARTGGAGTGGIGTGGARTGGMGTGGATNKALGVPCGTLNECASRFCVDGVCCESACTAPCRACGTGRCLDVTRAADAPECTGLMSCNAAAKCVSGG